ncbi:FAD-binding protein [Desulfobacula sp.]|uniref:FAD-binding oxidoreductase n=1 Tax=Desulfobacula sp. TaxID=2593537 RepID=UPI002638C244|nr:FAD-binding protein [Desulfobacula sp.]
MSISKEAYRALEGIVGPEYISQDPVIMDSYCFVWGNEVMFGDKFAARPIAVIIPGSAEEVQEVVKVCNQYNVKFRPHATGWEATALSAAEGFLPIDLRRLNKIIEINEDSMYGVVEPYVSIGALTIEATKKGMRCYSLGAGPSASVVASSTSHCGIGNASIFTGVGGRSVLGVEWILPDGKLLRLGSLGAGCGWFSGDGPGPSLRGAMRGVVGANGGLGVITKVAVKLTPWYGPKVLETSNNPPSYSNDLPENFKVFTMTFPTREDVVDALYLISEEEISHVCSRRGPFAVASGLVGSNEEMWELWKKGIYQKKCANSIVLIMDSTSPECLEYRVKVLNKIVEKTNGAYFTEDSHRDGGKYAHGLLGIGGNKGAFRAGGTFNEGPGAEETMDSLLNLQVMANELKEEFVKTGKLLDDGDPIWLQPFEQGQIGGHGEIPVRFDPCDKEAVKVAREHYEEACKRELASKLGIGPLEGGIGFNDEINDTAGPETMNYHLWMKKIKKALDPNLVSEASFYTNPKE